MNYNQAKEMVAEIQKIRKFAPQNLEINHHGFVGQLTAENMDDGKWYVAIWCVNAKAGNRTVTSIDDYNIEAIPLVLKKALGTATKRDLAALARIAAANGICD